MQGRDLSAGTRFPQKFKIQGKESRAALFPNSKFKISFYSYRHSEEGTLGPDEGISFPLSIPNDILADEGGLQPAEYRERK